MRKLVLYFVATVLVTITSCGSGISKTEPQLYDFDSTVDIDFNKVRVHEVIKPVDFVPTRNYLAVLHDAEFGEAQLYIYSLDSLRFMYSFAMRGMGPRETVALDVFRNAGEDNYLDLFDQSCYKRLRYELTDTGAVFIGSSHIDLPPMGPLQETWWVNDSVIVFSNLDCELMTYNVKNDSIIDTFRMVYLFEDCIDRADTRNLRSFQFSLCDDRLVIGMMAVNKLLTGRICDNKIEIDVPEEPILIPETTDRIYYTYVAQTDSLILAQYYGRKRPFISKILPILPDFSQEIGCFDEKLNPVCNLMPDMQTPRFFVDRKYNRILCWNQKSDFDYIYIFQIPR